MDFGLLRLYFFQAELPYHSDHTLEKKYAAYVVAESLAKHHLKPKSRLESTVDPEI